MVAVDFTPGKCAQKDYKDVKAAERKLMMQNFNMNRADVNALLAIMGLPDVRTVTHNASLIPCNCCHCVLHRQPDFAGQVSGLQEVLNRHNAQYHKNHQIKFLPKFHPELNPIERVWGRMKWYIRKFSDGKLETLERLMNEGLHEDNLPRKMSRKFVRLVTAYYLAYSNNLDIVSAELVIRQHRSHRGVHAQIDAQLDELYYPYGPDEEEDNDQEDGEEIDEGEAEEDFNVAAENNEEYYLQMVEEFHQDGVIRLPEPPI